ncbi:MAG: carbohydrate kinase family protein, partial [Candidatus Hodarchaeota archaeon]
MKSQQIEILCMGEVLIDLIADSKLECFCRFFGGSPANVAIQLAKLEHKTAFAGSVGMDFFGDFIIKVFESNNVNISLLSRYSLYPTSIVLINETKEPPFPIYHKSADFRYTFSEELRHMIDQITIFHTSAHALSFNPLRDTVLEAMKYAEDSGKIISFEPNYRPQINTEFENYKTTVLEALTYVDIVKPSIDDIFELFGEYLSPHESIFNFKDLGVKKTVILTCGSRGVYYNDEDENVQYEAVIPVKDVVGITGAGDAFWAGFLSSILRNQTIRQAIHSGLVEASKKIKYQ